MKNTVITSRRKMTEIITFLVCFGISNLLNFYSIIEFNTRFTELFTSIGYVLVCSVVIYLIWSFIRIIYYAISGVCCKKGDKKLPDPQG